MSALRRSLRELRSVRKPLTALFNAAFSSRAGDKGVERYVANLKSSRSAYPRLVENTTVNIADMARAPIACIASNAISAIPYAYPVAASLAKAKPVTIRYLIIRWYIAGGWKIIEFGPM